MMYFLFFFFLALLYINHFLGNGKCDEKLSISLILFMQKKKRGKINLVAYHLQNIEEDCWRKKKNSVTELAKFSELLLRYNCSTPLKKKQQIGEVEGVGGEGRRGEKE